MLAVEENGGDSQDLYREHVGPLLEWLAGSHHDWTVYSAELLQLNVLLTHTGEPRKWLVHGWVQGFATPSWEFSV